MPIYQATVETIKKRGAVVEMTKEDLFEVIRQQAADGADFMTIHCGINKNVLDMLTGEGRVMDVVSRGGSFITGWMLYNGKENPLYEYYDEILDICAEYDVTISLGDGLRPGCLADASDRAQLQELLNLGELTQRAWAKGVQVMVEGPGHVPYNQIAANMQLQKRVCTVRLFMCWGLSLQMLRRGMTILPRYRRHAGSHERRGFFVLCNARRAFGPARY